MRFRPGYFKVQQSYDLSVGQGSSGGFRRDGLKFRVPMPYTLPVSPDPTKDPFTFRAYPLKQ